MQTIRKSLDKITELGIPVNFSEIERFKSRFNNQMIFFTLVVLLLGAIPMAIYGQFNVLIGASVYFICQGISLLLAVFNLPKLSRSFNIASDFFVLFIGTYIAATDLSTYIFVFPLVSMVYFLIDNNKLKIIYVIVSLLSVLGILFMQAQNGFINLETRDYLNAYITIISLVLHINILVSFVKENELFHKKIAEKQEGLDNAQELAKLGTWVCRLNRNSVNLSKQLESMLNLDGNNLTVDSFLKTVFPENQYLEISNAQIKKFDIIFPKVINEEPYSFRAIGEILFDEDGQAYKIIGTLQDITERIKNENRINSLLDKLRSQNDLLVKQSNDLQRSNQELEQFAYVASHDLQEPLRMVGNFVQLLEEELGEKNNINEEERSYVNYIVDGVTRMGLLIDDLLQYSRVGRTDMKLKQVNLKEMIDKKIFDLSMKIKESNAKIEVNNLPEVFWCEPSQLSIVFYNLINNGIKFNNSKQPEVTVNCEEREKDFLFTISDNGMSIDPKNYNKIFEIFKRLHRKEIYEGTGIGLSLVKRIILKHGGNIWLKSDLGQGSTFYFTIPKI